jgi:hypothetical protein
MPKRRKKTMGGGFFEIKGTVLNGSFSKYLGFHVELNQ